MADIQKIIKAIDDELKSSGKNYLTPPEANLMLDRADLLNDRIERSGLPLRKLLRRGKIPHAYQISGKWRIPHSGSEINIQLDSPDNKSNTSPDKNKKMEDNHNFDGIKKQIETARLKYKPEKIKCLLIAEAPPNSIDRFFYYTDVKTADGLFLGVMQSLYPIEKQKYLDSGRDSKLKEQLLLKFKKRGFYLIDLLDYPLTYYSGNLCDETNSLIEKLILIVDDDTKIILIKVNVYDNAYSTLNDAGFNVVNKRIDFPASGGQVKFQNKFKEALKEANCLLN